MRRSGCSPWRLLDVRTSRFSLTATGLRAVSHEQRSKEEDVNALDRVVGAQDWADQLDLAVEGGVVPMIWWRGCQPASTHHLRGNSQSAGASLKMASEPPSSDLPSSSSSTKSRIVKCFPCRLRVSRDEGALT